MQSGGGPLQPGPPVMRGLTSGTPTSQQQPDMQKMQSQPPLMNQQYQQQNLFRSAGTNQTTRPPRPMMPAYHAPIYAPLFPMQYNPRLSSQWTNFTSLPGMTYPPQYYAVPPTHIISGQHQQNRRNPVGENNLVNVNSNFSAAPTNGGTNLNPLTPIPQMSQVQLQQPQPNQQSSPMTVTHDLLVMQQMHQPQPQQTPQVGTGAGQAPMDQHQPPNAGQVSVGGPPQPPHSMMPPQLQLPHMAPPPSSGAPPAAKVNKKKQRGSRAIPIINPETQEDVLEKIYNDSTTSSVVTSSANAPGVPPPTGNTATSYNAIPPNVPQVSLNQAVESDYDNYTPHTHQSTPELGLMHHQPPPHLSLLPPPPSHPPPHVHAGHPGGQSQMLLTPHDLGRSGQQTVVNSQQGHELVYPGGPIKIPPPHLTHPPMPQAPSSEMTPSGTPVVSAIADGPSVEIKPYQQKKKKPPSEIVMQQQPPPIQHSIDMQPPPPLKSLPPSSGSHLQHNIIMNEASIPMSYPSSAERYRTISEKSIAESTLSTDAEPFVYTGPSSTNTTSHQSMSQPPPRVEELPQSVVVSTPEVVPFTQVEDPQQHIQEQQESVSLKTEAEAEVLPPPQTKSISSSNKADSLVTSIEKLSLEDNSNTSSNVVTAGHHSSSSNSKKKQSKKRAEEVVSVASETSNVSNMSSSKAPATVVVVEQQHQQQLSVAAAAVDETDRSVVSTETTQQQSLSSSSLISNLEEHNISKLDNDNIINNNNVDCTNTTITNTTDNTIENNNTSLPMENTSMQQLVDSPPKLDIENNVQQQQAQRPELDDNKNCVVPNVESASVSKQSTPEPTTTNRSQQHTDEGSKLGAPPPTLPAKKSRSISLINYDPDQWSPDNPSGKRKYSRDQLLLLKNAAPAKEKPINLLNSLEYVLIKPTHGGTSSSMGGGQYGKPNFAEMSLLPTFIKDRMIVGAPGGGGGGMIGPMRQPFPAKRSSQQGNSGTMGSQSNKQSQQGMNKTGSKIIRLQLDEEVKLKECANAWRPRHLQTNESLDESDRVTQELFKKFRSILNKLTPENFDKLVQQVKELSIDTNERMDGCIMLIFEKAISEPNFSEAYAKMCKEIGTTVIPGIASTFKSRLLTQCQNEFEQRRNDQASAIRESHAKLQAAENLSKDEIDELKAQLEEEEQKVRRRAVGTVRFIGELFKHEQLTVSIMHTCLSLLLFNVDNEYDEETLECLCKLLTTVGPKIEKDEAERKQILYKYFEKMKEIVKFREHYKISSRIRFMIQDVIDLRRNNWLPRRQDLNPKTMNQIAKEAENEQIQINMNYIPRGVKDGGYSSDMGRGGRSMQGSGSGSKMSGGSMGLGYNDGTLGRGGNQGSMKSGRMHTDDDGFQQISNNRNNRSLAIDPKKFSFPSNVDPSARLGSASLYQDWKNNLYAALTTDESNLGGGGGSSGAGSMMDRNRDGDRDRDRSGSHRDRDRGDRDRNQRDRDRDRSGSHNKNSGGKDSYHHKGSIERDRYNRYGSSSSQNDDRMSRSLREPSSGSMRPMSGQHSNSQMHDRDRDRDRNMGSATMPSQPMPSRSSQQRHIPTQSTAAPQALAPSKSGSGQLYQPQQQQLPQFAIPKDAALKKSFPLPDDDTERKLRLFSKTVHVEMDPSDIEASIDMLKNIKSEYYHATVSQLFNDNIERDADSREMVVQVFARMFERKVITKSDYLHALEEIFKLAEDLIIDLPQLYMYIAAFNVLLLHKRYINLVDIRNVSQDIISNYGYTLLTELLLQYEKKYGRDATTMLWYESSLNFNDFIKLGSNDKVEKCLIDANLGYLLDTGSKSFDMQTVGMQIKQFLKNNAKFVEIFKWISEYVGPERETSNEFIRTLTKMVIEHCIDKTKLNLPEIQKWHQILQKYIDSKPERELQAMYAIQRLVVELEHPQNLLHSILEQLYDLDVIMEGFTLWKDCMDPLEQEGKGVCLKGITQFVTMFLENSTDEEN